MSKIELTIPQSKFLSLEAKFPLFVAGFGAGKSTALGISVLSDLNINATGIKIGVYCPTYDLLKLITIPYLEDLFYKAGIHYRLNKSDFIFYLSNGDQVIMRSMENPARIVGYETFRAHIDEIDTMPLNKANEAWNKIAARNRQKIYVNGKPIMNKVSAYSTPEGFNFCYSKWAKDPKEDYKMVQAPTYSNPHLPSDYIQSLRDTYPPQLVEAYIEGEFVNLTSGSVYPDFDRVLNHTNEEIKPREALHIGMDFNVLNMSAAIFVIRKGIPLLLDEISKARDTPDISRMIKERYPNRQIFIYPDSSGKNTSSKSASVSDLTILSKNGFNVRARNSNPFVKDRVASLCSKINNGNGIRSFFVNTNNCGEATECLEQQAYDKNGEPDKKSGTDHMNDAISYLIYYLYPIKSKTMTANRSVSHFVR